MTISYDKIFENNREWISKRKAEDPHFFEKLARTHNPDYLYIGCSDSRVAAEEMMGMEPGDAFVHRNVGNVISALDMNSTAVIQYAVLHLKVKHIVVCGHYGCGGVKAAMQAKDYGLLNPWLRMIRDVYRLHQDELDAIADSDERYRRLVELNVQEQCVNIIKMAVVQENYLANRSLRVHGWVFDIKTGELKDLHIDFEDILSKIQKIYNLSDEEWVLYKS